MVELKLSPLRRDAVSPQGVLVAEWQDGVPNSDKVAFARIHVNTIDTQSDDTVRRRFWLRDGSTGGRSWGWVTLPAGYPLATCDAGWYDVAVSVSISSHGVTAVLALVADDGARYPIRSAG